MRFLQSSNDFPLTVTLGNKAPSWGLSRWRGNGGLRFLPTDDEGFTLRGDKRRLLYQGRRRSHRFTILGDTAFEYDCILNKPPDTNTISLFIDGAENFDFFRQPDFLSNPLLAGSYAVYKKETFIGEGTGKLCHINRPEITDARGRRVWGDLSVVGNELRITIPEWWLSEAKYPVLVDPIVGSNQTGNQTTGQDPPYYFFDRPVIDNNVALNRYYVPEKIVGHCVGYVYCYWENNWTYLVPVLYTDNDNFPHSRKSYNEIDNYVKVNTVDPPGWRGSLFEIDGNVAAGSYVWFGARARLFTTYFDYTPSNEKLYKFYSGYNDELPAVLNPEGAIASMSIRFSWYFSFVTAPPGENYVFTLSSGVTLTDSKTHNADYKRIQTETVNGIDESKAAFFITRAMREIAGILDRAGQLEKFIRLLLSNVEAKSKTIRTADYKRTERNSVQAAGIVRRGLLLFIRIVTGAFARDYLLGRFLKAREELILKSAVSTEITLDSRIS